MPTTMTTVVYQSVRSSGINLTRRRKRRRFLVAPSFTLFGISVYLLLSGSSPCNGWTTVPASTNTGSQPASPLPVPDPSSLLALPFDDLATQLGGIGKAKACWECLRSGIDPVFAFNKADNSSSTSSSSFLLEKEETGIMSLSGWTRQQITEHLTNSAPRGTPLVLGQKTLDVLSFKTLSGLEMSIAELSKLTTAIDGTTKLLLRLKDGLEVETVIIPWHDRQTSTLCVSSQVGCKQACTFCSTGRMGKLRDLATEEILIQLFWANKICRLLMMRMKTTDPSPEEDNGEVPFQAFPQRLYPIQNVVFMGMGEPADNIDSVNLAARIMVDRRQFQLAGSKVVVSTVAPTPMAFKQIIGGNSGSDAAEVVLAWSLHSSRNDVRQKLVPTTRFSVEELREGLIEALQGRSKRLRNVMIEITLLDGINDSVDDARHVAEFCRPVQQRVPGLKLVVNLIPWNDIDAQFGPASSYRKSSAERVVTFQKTLTEDDTHKILCYVRTTRGDEEHAACGMLATKNKKK
jgi:23S rRNA (adenine2503-C2)-methyltransferase